MKPPLAILILLFLLISHHTIAQFSFEGFKEDSIGSYTNKFVKDSIIESITHSNADWEIREYVYIMPFSLLGRVYVIRSVNHKVEKYQIEWQQAMLAAMPQKPVRIFDPERGKYSQAIFITHYDGIPNLADDSSKLEQLMANHLFDIKDIGQTIDSLLSRKIQVVKLSDGDIQDGSVDTLHERPKNLSYIPYVEIKVGNHYRNFRISDRYESVNPGIATFNYYDAIFQELFNLIHRK